MIGPSLSSRGGISSICNEYDRAGFFDRFDIRFIASFETGAPWRKLLVALRCAVQLLALLVRRQVSLVHLHVASGSSIWRKQFYSELAALFGVPYVVHLHSGKMPEYYERQCGPVRRRLLSRLLARSKTILVLSEERRAWLEREGLKAPRVEVLPNFVAIPAAVAYDCRGADVVFVGRLEEAKGVSTLLQAFALVLSAGCAARLILAGEGDLSRYEAMSEELGIAHCTRFVGWVDGQAKTDLIASAAVVALPSLFEGLPMSLLEAMSHGVPCVATPVGGVPDIIQDDVNGRIVPISDSKILGSAIETLLRDRQYNIKLGMSARQTIKDRFSAAAVEDILLRIYG